MFKIQEIREIIKLVDASTIDEFVYEAEGSKVKLKKNGGVTEVVAPKAVAAPTPVVEQKVAPTPVAATPAPAETQAAPAPTAVAVADEDLHKITSPMVGTFYQSPNPD